MDINTYPQFLSRFTTGSVPPEMTLILAIIIVWSMAWKGAALWKAARNNEKYWFIAILVINTVGILEIAYIYFFAKNRSGVSGQTHTVSQ